ncbi:MAG: hypothetical protein IJG65_09065 [Synergistaceae bacterium]|nr:hypothetical protein [Synergistaceae bacterium]
MCEVTVVCCWNNEELYGGFVNSLKVQDTPCEIIGIDNRDNKNFTSCAAAYNSVINQVKTKYVIYSHQDILFNDRDNLGKFLSYLERVGIHDVLGVAGVTVETKGIFTDITSINPYTGSGELVQVGEMRVEGGMMECFTVDECFFGGYSQHFREQPFDEDILFMYLTKHYFYHVPKRAFLHFLVRSGFYLKARRFYRFMTRKNSIETK